MINAPLAERMRPTTLDEYIGQAHLLAEGAALRRALDAGVIPSMIFWGPPGVGKTTLAQLIAKHLDRPIHTLSAISSGVKDVREVINRVENGGMFQAKGTILFIDEIHRLSRPVEEILYPAMEDFQIDIVVGKGPAASSIRLTLPRFTLIGATTRTGMITGPLRDRFGLVARLDYYDAAELDAIVQRTSRILDVPLSDDASLHIARRSRGTPRIANRLLRRVRDFAEVRGDGTINSTTALEALRVFGVDELGLDKVDRAILRSLCEQFDGGPVGLTTLAIAVGEQPETVEDVYEPFLIQQGLIARTPRGRVAMDAARSHLANP